MKNQNEKLGQEPAFPTEPKQEVIGKFVVATQDIKANQKLNIECYDITEMKSLS